MRNFDFSSLCRSAIGFDRLFDMIEDGQWLGNNEYPSYNVELVNDNHYRIIINTAGFTENELEIIPHNNLLIIKGIHSDESATRNYLYQGITEHNFERKFQLAEHIQITDANLENGLLYIDLTRVVPEKMKPRHIDIK
ncbi:MAG: small heat shock chaperone IbpA [Candidatus Malihini olakiniferum]